MYTKLITSITHKVAFTHSPAQVHISYSKFTNYSNQVCTISSTHLPVDPFWTPDILEIAMSSKASLQDERPRRASDPDQIHDHDPSSLITDRARLPLYPATYFEQKQLIGSVPNPVFLFNVQHYRRPHGAGAGGRAFVRMPYNQLGNSSSLGDLTSEKGGSGRGPLWNTVREELSRVHSRLVQVTSTSFGLIPPGEHEPIIKAIQAYNPTGSRQSNFGLLRYFFETSSQVDYENNLKAMGHVIEQALALPKLMPHPIPLLQSQENKTLVMSQQQVFSLIANGFLCTFGGQPGNYPEINFFGLFSSSTAHHSQFTSGDHTKLEKLQCIFNYFYSLYLRNKFELWSHGNVVTFERRYLKDDEIPAWSRCDLPLSEVEININGKIEDCGVGMLQVDFANSKVGGGLFEDAAAMEEIRFSICPELIVARLFTEELGEDEVLLITGCEQFSTYAGSGVNFRCTGLYNDPAATDSLGRIATEVVAMDPLHFYQYRKWEQFSLNNIHRELNKCYTGFMLRKPTAARTPVASGNWGAGGGCNGDPELKFLIQYLAASAVGRKLVMFVNANESQADAIEDIVIYLKRNQITVQILYQLIRICGSELVRLPHKGPRLFSMIKSDVRCTDLIRGENPAERGMEYGRGRRAAGKNGTGRVRQRPRKKQFEDMCRQT